MAGFKVNTELLRQQNSSVTAVHSSLNQILQQLNQVSFTGIQISGAATIRTRISACKTALREEAASVKSFATTIDSISQRYVKNETDLAECKTGAQRTGSNTHGSSGGGSGGGGGGAWDSSSSFDWKTFWKAVGSVGLVGTVVGSIGQAVTGDNLLKDVLTGGTKVTEKAAKYISDNGTTFDWKSLFGLNNSIANDSPTTFMEVLKEEVSKLNPGKATDTAGKISTYAKWAGYAVTAGFTTYENFTDPENTTLGRKIAESVGETGVKIAEGILVGAAVKTAAAALIAVCPATAAVVGSAIVVGAATVAVTWAIDSIVESVTGKDTAEAISDFVIDSAVNAYQNVRRKASEALAGAKAVGEAVSGWWSGLFQS
jgi:hypothetical protein